MKIVWTSWIDLFQIFRDKVSVDANHYCLFMRKICFNDKALSNLRHTSHCTLCVVLRMNNEQSVLLPGVYRPTGKQTSSQLNRWVNHSQIMTSIKLSKKTKVFLWMAYIPIVFKFIQQLIFW